MDEANKLGIPIVAICDTNSDPDLITVPIAGNDDAIRSVELICQAIAATIEEARREAPTRDEVEESGESTTWSSERGTEKESDDDAPQASSAPPSGQAGSDRRAPQGWRRGGGGRCRRGRRRQRERRGRRVRVTRRSVVQGGSPE